MKYLTSKNLLIAIILFLIVIVSFVIYRMFFQFNSKDVAIYIDEAAKQYGSSDKAFKLIQDGVEFILSDRNLTQQVLTMSSINKTPKEQELVHAAVMQCVSNGYLSI